MQGSPCLTGGTVDGSLNGNQLVAHLVSGTSKLEVYAPLVGPWLDLAQRGACTSGCEAEAAYKVLLVANGLAQGVGMLGIFSGILVAGFGTKKANVKPSVQLAPMIFGKGSMGAGLMGTFSARSWQTRPHADRRLRHHR